MDARRGIGPTTPNRAVHLLGPLDFDGGGGGGGGALLALSPLKRVLAHADGPVLAVQLVVEAASVADRRSVVAIPPPKRGARGAAIGAGRVRSHPCA
jgi:hypothetical protein